MLIMETELNHIEVGHFLVESESESNWEDEVHPEDLVIPDDRQALNKESILKYIIELCDSLNSSKISVKEFKESLYNIEVKIDTNKYYERQAVLLEPGVKLESIIKDFGFKTTLYEECD